MVMSQSRGLQGWDGSELLLAHRRRGVGGQSSSRSPLAQVAHGTNPVVSPNLPMSLLRTLLVVKCWQLIKEERAKHKLSVVFSGLCDSGLEASDEEECALFREA